MGPAEPRTGDLLADLPDASAEERFEPLAAAGGFRIERIVSHGQASPPGFWYEQETAEWVLLVAGAARVELAEPRRTVELAPGDWLHLPVRCRHRVAWTDDEGPTVWLAVHETGARRTGRRSPGARHR